MTDDGGNGNFDWSSAHTDQLRGVMMQLEEKNKYLQERLAETKKPHRFAPYMNALLTAAILGGGVWVYSAITSYAKDQIVAGTAKVEDVTQLKSDNETAHKTINTRLDTIDDRTFDLYQVLVEQKRPDKVKEAASKRTRPKPP